ncbi:MAG TPA: MFS transporter [Gaiellaceae bacterium]|nr:MFS transporter [Gaiellaceae bacterium]
MIPTRWVVLTAGTFAQATYSAIWFGVAVMAPPLRDELHLSLGQTGLLISASLAGSVVSLIPWGLATDQIGERWVLLAGVGGCGLALLGASLTSTFEALLLLLMLAGFLGASVQSASGRAVMAWFPGSQRGLALGIRQTAIPISGFAASLALPPIVHAGGTGWGFAAMGLACVAAAVVGALVLRDIPLPDGADAADVAPLRDRRLWRLSIGSALVLAPQMCVVGFTVLLLHDHRGLSPGHAAAVLAVVQLLGIVARIGAGRWSDVAGSRLRPLRLIALAVAVFVTASAALLSAPLVVFIPALVVAGVLSMSWNGLSFAAAVEVAGHRRSGAAIGLQQSLLNGSGAIYPGLFGVLVGATSWWCGFVACAGLTLAGWRVLLALPE